MLWFLDTTGSTPLINLDGVMNSVSNRPFYTRYRASMGWGLVGQLCSSSRKEKKTFGIPGSLSREELWVGKRVENKVVVNNVMVDIISIDRESINYIWLNAMISSSVIKEWRNKTIPINEVSLEPLQNQIFLYPNIHQFID